MWCDTVYFRELTPLVNTAAVFTLPFENSKQSSGFSNIGSTPGFESLRSELNFQ